MPDWIGQLKEAGPGQRWQVQMKRLAELFDPETGREEPDWEDEDVREVCANWALKLGQTAPETKVFEATGLNPKNPFHWRILFIGFCASLVQEKKTRGRKPKWIEKRSALLRDFAIVRKDRPTISDVGICRFMKKRYPSKYGPPNQSPTAERIAREVKKAHNHSLQKTIGSILRVEALDHAKKGLLWNDEVKARKSSEYAKMLEAFTARRSPGK
jgi:hypothetical protein